MRWCRLYVETPDDPKLRRIAYAAGTSVSHTLAVWTTMLCFAAENEGEAWGTLTGWDDLTCALTLGIDRAVVFKIRCEMEGRTLDGLNLMAWNKRQHAVDDATGRWRKWRDKKRGVVENQQVKSEPTLDQRGANVVQTRKTRTEQTRIIVEAKASTHPSAARRGRAASEDEAFEAFWALYPRKVGKGAAKRAWPKAVQAAKGDAGLIVDGVKIGLAINGFDMREGGRFCPHPSTWLNAERWLDGIEPDDLQPAAMGAH